MDNNTLLYILKKKLHDEFYVNKKYSDIEIWKGIDKCFLEVCGLIVILTELEKSLLINIKKETVRKLK